ncbi:MAG: hypothetical protein IT535_10105 [Bauldia sp.]|nr:hypothetical protein [Bauldia sp.]
MQSIDLAYLKRHGFLTTLSSGTLRWSRHGEETGSIRFTVTSAGVRLSYRTRPYGEDDWTDVDELVPFAWSGTNFGGQRRWFVCLSCRRPCRVLYGGSRFRCRRCQRLTYGSQYEPRWQRGLTRAQKVRMKLGGSGSMDDVFPLKPKGMHWRTYRRLEQRDELAEQSFAWLVSNWSNRGLL